MPELPEVETFVRQLRPLILGQKIKSFQVDAKGLRMISPADPMVFVEKIEGLTISAISRKGKFIILHLESHDEIIIHLRMSGRLIFSNAHLEHAHKRLSLEFLSGTFLNFIDIRRFGTFHLAKAKAYKSFKNLGPDALSHLKLKELYQKAKQRHKAIHKLLLDQSFISGIGNIYANEALFLAGINPFTNSRELNEKRFTKLITSACHVMNMAIKMRGTTLIDKSYKDSKNESGKFFKLLKVYGRKGEKCSICQNTIKTAKIGGRSVFFCSTCQK